MKKKPYYADLADLPEDKRIELIGDQVITGKVVSFVTDADPGKMDRYITKLKAMFPSLRVIDRGDGPVADTVWAKVSL